MRMGERSRALAAAALLIATAACGGGAPTVQGNDTSGSPAAAPTCTGPTPANATLCPGADAGLAADTPRSVAATCACVSYPCVPAPCSYACDPGYALATGGTCAPVTPPAVVSPFEDLGDGTVADRSTGLVWLKDADCTDTVGGLARPGPGPYDVANTWTAFLSSGACGLSDGSTPGSWRLPTDYELLALAQSLTDGSPFVHVQPTFYWTSFSPCIAVFGGIQPQTGAYREYPVASLLDVWPVRR